MRKIKIVESADDIVLGDSKVVGFDIETSPRGEYLEAGRVGDIPPDPRLHKVVLAQVATNDNVYVLTKKFDSLKPLMEDKSVTKIIHNASFEYKHMLHRGINIKNIFDTMLFVGVYDNGRQPALDLRSTCLRFLGKNLSKEQRDRFINGDRIDRKMIEYGAEDADVLVDLYSKFKSLKTYEEFDRVLGVENSLVKVSGSMEYRGFKVSRRDLQATVDQVKSDYAKVKKTLIKMLPMPVRRITIDEEFEGADAKLNSRDFMLDMFRRQGIDLPDLRKLTVFEYSAKVDNELLKTYTNYVTLQKRLSTYGDTFIDNINPDTGRIHQRVNQVNARTGRLAGSNPNLMNIPKDEKIYRYRRCFIAAKGKILVAIDYSQQEMRILAEFSRDKRMIEAFEKDMDFHVHVARILFRDQSIDEKDPRRRHAKNLNFGLIYGMGIFKLAKELKCSVTEAEELTKLHAREFPGAFEWMTEEVRFAQEYGYVTTLLGRRRYLDTNISKFEREARNTPIQGTAADMIKIALIAIDNRKYLGDIVNVVHDEIVLECDEKIGRDVLEAARGVMIKSAGILVKNVPFDADGYVSKRWQKPNEN